MSTIMYRVNYLSDSIDEVEVISKTKSYIAYIHNGHPLKVSIRSHHCDYHQTKQEAVAALKSKLERTIANAEHRIEMAKQDLEKLNEYANRENKTESANESRIHLIGGKILTPQDLEQMNEQEVKNRNYTHCDILINESDDLYLATVQYNNDKKAWEPLSVVVDSTWMSIDEFDNTEMGKSYTLGNYR